MNNKSRSKAGSINPNISRHTSSNASAPGLSFLNAAQDGYTKIHHKKDPPFIPPAPQSPTEQQKMRTWSDKRYGNDRTGPHRNTHESITSTQSAPAYNQFNNQTNIRKQNAFAAPNINPSMQPQINRHMTHDSIPMNQRSMSYNNTMNRNMNMNMNRNPNGTIMSMPPIHPHQQSVPIPQRHGQSMPNMQRYATVPTNMNPQRTGVQYAAHRGPVHHPQPQQPIQHIQHLESDQDHYVELGQPVISETWATSGASDKGTSGIVRGSVSKSKDAYKQPLLEDDIDYEDVRGRKITDIAAKHCCCVIL